MNNLWTAVRKIGIWLIFNRLPLQHLKHCVRFLGRDEKNVFCKINFWGIFGFCVKQFLYDCFASNYAYFGLEIREKLYRKTTFSRLSVQKFVYLQLEIIPKL